MMNTQLCRYVDPVQPDQLERLLAGSLKVEIATLSEAADLSEVHEKVRDFGAEVASAPGGLRLTERAKWDGQLVEPLHRALPITRRTAADMRFWHWLTTTELRDFVLLRWLGRLPSPSDLPEEVSRGGIAGRFLGKFTLRGVSRNALARLWWCGETLRSEDGDYGLARKALFRQDLFQAVFERNLGMCRPTARACFSVLAGAPEKDFRNRMKRLDHYATTISLEALSEAEVEQLLIEMIGDAPTPVAANAAVLSTV